MPPQNFLCFEKNPERSGAWDGELASPPPLPPGVRSWNGLEIGSADLIGPGFLLASRVVSWLPPCLPCSKLWPFPGICSAAALPALRSAAEGSGKLCHGPRRIPVSQPPPQLPASTSRATRPVQLLLGSSVWATAGSTVAAGSGFASNHRDFRVPSRLPVCAGESARPSFFFLLSTNPPLANPPF